MSNYSIELACRILDLLDGKISTSELDDIAEVYAGKNKKEKLRFLNLLNHMVEQLPISLWDGVRERSFNLNTISSYIDSITMRQMGSIKYNELYRKSHFFSSK